MEEDNKTLTVQEYFDKVKSLKQDMTDTKLKKLSESSLSLLKRFLVTKQKDAARKVYQNLKCIEKEHTLLKRGINTFIYKDDLDNYLENVADRTVKVTKLENYSRVIPDDIIKRIEETQDIFTDFFVVFTDYTGREERKVETESRNKDPILLGAFINENDKTHDIDFNERMYYIGDWVDEYCDLTLEKLIAEYEEEEGYSPIHEIEIPTTYEEAKQLLETGSLNGSETED